MISITKPKPIVFIFLLLLILIAGFKIWQRISYLSLQKQLPENTALNSKIQTEVLNSTSDILVFNTLTDFDWDQMYILGPYSKPELTFEHTDIQYDSKMIDDSIRNRDDINLIVFTNKNKIVSYVNLQRNIEMNIDKFDPDKKDFFTPDTAVFDIERTDMDFILLSPAHETESKLLPYTNLKLKSRHYWNVEQSFG